MFGTFRLSHLFCTVPILTAALVACGGSEPTNVILGNYAVQVAVGDKSDPTVATISPGVKQTVLLTFTSGVMANPGGPNPYGIRGNLDPMEPKFTIEEQPIRILHSTGKYTGSVVGDGEGNTDGSGITIFLRFTPDGDGTAMPTDFVIRGGKI